ncbi:PAS domain S-box protein [Gelidibacter maritimus]|uniref:histidine kinase n=1 Tax=Gelidibacter maritimus TaxID=2761487 RepID=A0A7W2M4B9_9FLAO|nr:PAS domain S-box protein [Gelidibacter maritimus]MBA6152430.1 PAS domain S-box protein [Gelidibacter maritimus]
MIDKSPQTAQFSLVDSTIYDLFSSDLYDGVWFTEKSNIYDFVISKSFKNLLGYESDQKLTWDSIIYPDDRKRFSDHLNGLCGNKKVSIADDLRIIHKSGTLLWLQCHIYFSPHSQSTHQFVFIAFKNVSKKRAAELDIIHQQKKAHEILSDSSIGTWECDIITGETYSSESLAQTIGYTTDELKQLTLETWRDLMHPDDLLASQEIFEEHINSRSSCFSNQYRIKHKNGHWVWVTSIGKVTTFSKDNQPKRLEGILYEITDRKRHEFQLSKYKELLEGVNKVAKIGVWEIDLNTNQVDWSDEIKTMFGVPTTYQPSVEDAISFFKPGESRQKIQNAIENAIENGQNYDIEVQVLTSDDSYMWTRAIGVTEHKDGKCIRLYGFFQNIHKKAIASKNLAIKEELFRKTFSYAPVGMAIIDLQGNISRANKVLCECLGYSEKELLQNNFNKFTHPEDSDISNVFIDELVQKTRETFKIDKRYIHKNGSTIWTHVSVSSVKNDLNKITHFVVQVQDITERKKNEILLTDYQNLLERSNYMAKIGSWEINVDDYTVKWSKSLRKIINTRDNLVPTFLESIDFFVGNSPQREVLQNALNKALKEGVNFDLEVLVKADGRKRKWIRMVGISEFEDGKCTRLYGLIQDINDIKKAQLAITVKEEQWRTTFNHAKAGMAIINFNGTADNVNRSLCEIFGYSMNEMLEIGIKDISLSEDLDRNIELMDNLINGASDNFTDDLRFLHRDGRVIWANVSVSAVKNDFNKFTHMVAQVVDITETKTNQILLKKYKDSLERSNTLAKIGSWEIDPETKLLFWNSNLGRLLGTTDYTPISFTDAIKQYILPENQEHLLNLVNNAIKKGVNFDLEIQLNTNSGIRWMRMLGVSDFEDGSCNMLHGLIQDIDDFKMAQLEIVLREEEFRQTFWHAPIGMALLDLNGKIIKVNPVICETFGYTEQEMIDIEKSAISHPEDLDLTSELIEEVLHGERESFQQEKRYFHKDGKLIWANLSISAVKNDQGETTHLVLQVSNTTDKKLLTESLKEHNNRLQNYAHIVSHNLRSHTGNLSMLLELIELNDHQGCNNELFGHIKSASDNMNETVQHLSEIVEINNLIKDTLVPQNLKKRVYKSIENIQSTLDQINAELTIKINDYDMVYAVPSYLDSILLNLLTNAIKYRSPYRLLKIEINTGKRNGHTYLSISDNGLGIDLDKNGLKIFGMYKTFHEHKDARGIGLFISKNQMEAMGGRIDVESQPNIGSTFTLYFNDEKN